MYKKIMFHSILLIIVTVTGFFSNPNIILGNENLDIKESETLLYFETDKLPVTLYEIGNEDYVPLTAIINLFDMEAKYNDSNGQIIITQTENAQKEFYHFLNYEQHVIKDSTHTMEFYGNEFSIPNLKLVNNYNFIPVNELGNLFGYKLLYDKIPNSVVMSNDYYFSFDEEALAKLGQYLNKNTINFAFDNMEPLKVIDFENYNIYLLGENHAISKNTEIKLNFIKFLYKNYGVRYIIDESGYCDTIMLNHFLQTGDTSILEENIESVKKTFGYTKENYDFYNKLYKFNQSLPENEKITIVGIDVQHNWEKGLHIIKLFIDDQKNSSDIIKEVFNIIGKENLKPEDVKTALDIIDKNKSEFEQYFGDSYLDFYFGLRSIWQSMEFYVDSNFATRERFIHENITDYYTSFDIKKCFGMFGGAHTMLNGVFDKDKNLAQYLNTDFTPTRDKVLSIMCMYKDSYYMDKYTGAPEAVIPNYGKTLNKLLAESVVNSYGICSTGDIPFEDGKLSDMFQYMLSVKDSSSSTPFGSFN